jgi:hypothetical protein
VQKPAAASGIELGSVVNGVYCNKTLGLSYKIPAGWVLRTDEMNERDEPGAAKSSTQGAPGDAGDSNAGRVLLAAFSRPPDARGEDVNASIVIAAESVQAYPGLKEAAQYFGPLTEVATAQGFTADEEPYEFEVGTRKLVRGDFHKDVGTRVMHQSTLAWLAHGYAVSITVIGGTEDGVESLIDGVTFTPPSDVTGFSSCLSTGFLERWGSEDLRYGKALAEHVRTPAAERQNNLAQRFSAG